MSTLSDLVLAQGRSNEADVEWLHLLVGDWQLLADLAFADIVLWVPSKDDSFVAVAHARPSSSATLFYRDFVGQEIKPEWRDQVTDAFRSAKIIDSSAPDWYEETPTRVRAVPVLRRLSPSGNQTTEFPIAVITRHTNLSEARTPSRQELTFNECANDLFGMIASGDFPDLAAPTGPRRGAPRASDGLIRLDVDGTVTFASPNGLSAFNRMGFVGELEGESLAEVTTGLLTGKQLTVDESLPLVVTGRAPWRTDIEARGVTVSLRAIPMRTRGERVGAIVLCRDVTEVRHQERELITKDATIREIHHRVKNNLQTVASLLRIQARRTHNDSAKEALQQAMRRVAAIAVVHDTLSEGLSQTVDFDAVFDRVLLLVAEVASSHNTTVHPKSSGSFGTLPSEYATPLALALTELVTNAVEHGLAGRDGEVEIIAKRTDDYLSVKVRDNGVGLPEGKVGSGLGTQIVRTLIQGELGGTIDWHTLMGSGTEVTIDIPLTWLNPR
ncbi:sensor histidine kinase [Glaciihabitans sp. dw_435]|uniref:sensor histidine kinase n=1 Tax=Glaciihabitans sp. dw_435 TaxID=2720081 RepID=UPI001BD56B6B|nr:PAS domain-containing sensor histidine kinase [Glaciihabitans sp. dw_435]